MIARKDIDAVLIALPDHWHSIPVIEAARVGKDIYGKKPLSLIIAEGFCLEFASIIAVAISTSGIFV